MRKAKKKSEVAPLPVVIAPLPIVGALHATPLQPASPQRPAPQRPAPFEKDLKQNPCFADFVKYMELKVTGTKEIQNGHAADDSLNAEDANSDEEDSGELAEPEL
jgi:hypothetical protein